MPFPAGYERKFGFEGFQDTHPSTPLPGTQVDVELDGVAKSTAALTAFIQKFARADGRLANGSVGVDQLAADFSVGFKAPTTWEPGIAYVLNDTVFYGAGFYTCVAAHVSAETFAPANWSIIVDFGTEALAAAASAAAAAASAAAAAESATAIAGPHYAPIATVEAMQALGTQSLTLLYVWVRGPYGGPYEWSPASTATAKAGVVYAATGVTTGRWIRSGLQISAPVGVPGATAYQTAPYIDISWMGADSTLTDNAVFVQQAHDLLPATGGTIQIPNTGATLNCTTLITITKPNVRLRFTQGATLHWTALGANKAAITVTASGFCVSGGGKITGPTVGSYVANERGVYVKGASVGARLTGFVFEDTEVSGFGSDGVLMEFCDAPRLARYNVHDCGYVGVGAYSSNNGIAVAGTIKNITPGTVGNSYGLTLSHDSSYWSNRIASINTSTGDITLTQNFTTDADHAAISDADPVQIFVQYSGAVPTGWAKGTTYYLKKISADGTTPAVGRLYTSSALTTAVIPSSSGAGAMAFGYMKFQTAQPMSAGWDINGINIDNVDWTGLDTHQGLNNKFRGVTVTNCQVPISIAQGSGAAGDFCGGSNVLENVYVDNRSYAGTIQIGVNMNGGVFQLNRASSINNFTILGCGTPNSVDYPSLYLGNADSVRATNGYISDWRGVAVKSFQELSALSLANITVGKMRADDTYGYAFHVIANGNGVGTLAASGLLWCDGLKVIAEGGLAAIYGLVLDTLTKRPYVDNCDFRASRTGEYLFANTTLTEALLYGGQRVNSLKVTSNTTPTTVDVSLLHPGAPGVVITSQTTGVSITNFTNGKPGQTIVVHNNGVGNVTITRDHAALPGSANLVIPPLGAASLMLPPVVGATSWVCTSAQITNG